MNLQAARRNVAHIDRRERWLVLPREQGGIEGGWIEPTVHQAAVPRPSMLHLALCDALHPLALEPLQQDKGRQERQSEHRSDDFHVFLRPVAIVSGNQLTASRDRSS
jgi:hypothetical protein